MSAGRVLQCDDALVPWGPRGKGGKGKVGKKKKKREARLSNGSARPTSTGAYLPPDTAIQSDGAGAGLGYQPTRELTLPFQPVVHVGG